MADYRVPYFLDLAGSVALPPAHRDRRQPEDRLPAVWGNHVDVGWSMFSRIEQVSVWSKAKQFGHADLADRSTGDDHGPMHFTAAYPDKSVVSRA
jgi:hypothetical protein